MKKILLACILVFQMLFISVSADAQDFSIDTDSAFSAFTNAVDSSLDGWESYTDKASIGNKWVLDTENYLVQNNAIGETAGAGGSIFYLDKNFGSEFKFSGIFNMTNNQVGVYFNSSVSTQSGKIDSTGGYRIYIDRSKIELHLQKYIDGEWVNVATSATKPSGFSGNRPFEVTFKDGVISASVNFSGNGTHTLYYDDSEDGDYFDSGYIGFYANATLLKVSGINVAYNSEKVYKFPELKSCSDFLCDKAYNVLKTGETTEIFVEADAAATTDVTKVELYVDDVLVKELTKDSQNEFLYKSTFTVPEKGPHSIRVEVTDKTGGTKDFCNTSFFSADFYASNAVFKLSDGTILDEVGSSGLSNVTASIDFNPYSKDISSVTLVAVKFNGDKTINKIYKNSVACSADTITNVSCPIDTIEAGKTVTVFLCESMAKPAPLSGGFTLE